MDTDKIITGVVDLIKKPLSGCRIRALAWLSIVLQVRAN